MGNPKCLHYDDKHIYHCNNNPISAKREGSISNKDTVTKEMKVAIGSLEHKNYIEILTNMETILQINIDS